MKFNSFFYTYKCLQDKERIKSYHKTICKLVLKSDTVVICGSLCGFLAVQAAGEGASVIHVYEPDVNCYRIAAKAIIKSPLREKIHLHKGDGTSHKEKANVVIFSPIETMLASTDVAKIANAMVKNKVITKDTYVMPKKVTTFFQASEYDFSCMDQQFLIPTFADSENIKNNLISAQSFKETKLNQINDLKVKFESSFVLGKSGIINSLIFSSVTSMTDNILIGKSSFSNQPIVFPLENPVEVSAGGKYSLGFEYVMGGGVDKVKVHVRSVS